MRMYDLIRKKKTGLALTNQEIIYMVEGFTKGEIPDYQMSAMLMAICFQGMTEEETLHLTLAMAHSGDSLDLSNIHGVKCDKHSTGGVGDKVSLILSPMAAAAGIPVAKMSGRGLGHTGGTIDKLESIKGFHTAMEEEDFIRQVNEIGIALVGQTAHLAPADKKIYALRDVTATVDSMPLIASSIMSKKLAAGADTIILDVKCGNGAFMKEETAAIQLAETMVKIGNGAGRRTIAIVSDMNEPLGYTVGNALEVWEALEVLQGRGEKKLTSLCITLGAYMLYGTGMVEDVTLGEKQMQTVLEEGLAYKKFLEWMKAQGADPKVLATPKELLSAKNKQEILSDREGYVSEILSDEVGLAALMLGAGRETLDSQLDYQAGFHLLKKTGDYVKLHEPIGICYANDSTNITAACHRVLTAYHFSDTKPQEQPFIKAVIQE